jgi:hypothetical protein
VKDFTYGDGQFADGLVLKLESKNMPNISAPLETHGIPQKATRNLLPVQRSCLECVRRASFPVYFFSKQQDFFCSVAAAIVFLETFLTAFWEIASAAVVVTCKKESKL